LPIGTDLELLTDFFRHEVFRSLLDAHRISPATVERMLGWTHSGFNVHRGNHLQPEDSAGRQQVARYLLHPPLSLDRMTYDAEKCEVTYRSDRQNRVETFDAVDWLARVASHIPDKGSQLVRYFGAYSNRVRGMQKKAAALEQPIEPRGAVSEPRAPVQVRKSWARLLAAVWLADPLCCPRCGAPMRILGPVYDPQVIRKILRHLGLWDVPARAPPRPPPCRGPDFADRSGLDAPSPTIMGTSGSQPDLSQDPAISSQAAAEEAVDPWLDSWPEADPIWDD
jgi:hypothetical protein